MTGNASIGLDLLGAGVGLDVERGARIGRDARSGVDNRATWPQNWTPGMPWPDPRPSGVRFTLEGRVNGCECPAGRLHPGGAAL